MSSLSDLSQPHPPPSDSDTDATRTKREVIITSAELKQLAESGEPVDAEKARRIQELRRASNRIGVVSARERQLLRTRS